MSYGGSCFRSSTARFASADTIVPDPANPQSWNRYSYTFNNPLNFTDPSGHDPLDEQWQAAFREAHGRDPEREDRLIRLFSIAFPDEWNWSDFYDDNGMLRDGALDVLTDPPDSRDWADMPNVLARLSEFYEWNESEEFAHDIGTLFAGLPDRFSGFLRFAITGCETGYFCGDEGIKLPAYDWAYLQPNGMPSKLTGYVDPDANVHHWAWGVAFGYHIGTYAVAVNTIREYDQAEGIRNAWNSTESKSDIWLGNRGVFFGTYLRILGPQGARFLYGFYVAE